MAVKGLTALTLADWGKRVDPNGKVDKIIELLGQTNPILQDMPFVEGNLPTGHRTTIRSGLPSATWRLLNYGVQPSKSTTVQVTDSVGMLETYAEVDKSLADLNGNTAEFRLSEDRAFIEVKWFTEFGHLNRGDMLTSEQHRCHNEKKKFQRRV